MDRAERFRAARRDPRLAVLEGFHALKHAVRFGAEVLEASAAEDSRVDELATELAPDLADGMGPLIQRVPRADLEKLSPSPVPTGVIAIARRPPVDPRRVLGNPRPAPIVLLEAPRRPENVGAVVRVAAAAEAAGVLTTGDRDPWQPAALRGAAGLHFAVLVALVAELPATDRPIVALHPDGEPLGALPPRALLAVGTERAGLSPPMLERADLRLRIPMREGVSSLNLATAVAVALYAQHYRGAAGTSAADRWWAGPPV